LAEIADRIRQVVRSADIPCRVGGDEFAVIVPEVEVGQARQLVGRIQRAVSAQPIARAGRVRVSAGVADIQPNDSPTSLFWVGLATNFLITGSFGTGLGYTAELFPTQIRGTGVGASFTFGLAVASLAPMIMGWIATAHSVAAGLPLLAVSFLLLAPLFIWFAPDMTRKELTDFVGQRVG